MWISVTLHADADKAEALSDALMEAGALSLRSGCANRAEGNSPGRSGLV